MLRWINRTNARTEVRPEEKKSDDVPKLRNFKEEAWFISAMARASLTQKAQVDRSKEPTPFVAPESVRANPRPLTPIPQRIIVKFPKPPEARLRNKRVLDVKKMGFVDCTEPQPKLPFGPEVLGKYPSNEHLAREKKRRSSQVHEFISAQTQIEKLAIRTQQLAISALLKEEDNDVA